MSRIYSDPTANTAISNVMRQQREKARLAAKQAAEPCEEPLFRRDPAARRSLPISRKPASGRR